MKRQAEERTSSNPIYTLKLIAHHSKNAFQARIKPNPLKASLSSLATNAPVMFVQPTQLQIEPQKLDQYLPY